MVSKTTKLHIIHYTDAHGRYLSKMPHDSELRDKGLDRLATYLQELTAKGEEYLLIDNGDSIQGTPLVDLHPKAPALAKLKHPLNILHDYLNVDVFIPGNHEFNFGDLAFKEAYREAKNHWLCANILDEGKPLFPAFHIFEKAGIKIAVYGLITEYVPRWESAENLNNLSFPSILPIADKDLPALRKQCDLLVVSYHGGITFDPKTGKQYCANQVENQAGPLWSNHPEIDLLFLGHQHRIINLEDPTNATLIQADCHGRHWADVTLTIEAGAVTSQTSEIIKASNYAPDPKLTELYQDHLTILKEILKQPLGTADHSFQVSDPMSQVWTKKHPMIQWINELMMQLTGAKIAACSLLDIEVKGLPPEVTTMDILNAYFFQDSISLLELKGETLLAALEQIASFFIIEEGTLAVNPDWAGIKIRSYNYDIFDGIHYQLDIKKPVGKRVVSAHVAGQPILKSEIYPVAVSTYRAGAGFYEMYDQAISHKEFPNLVTDLMMVDLQKKGHLKLEPIQNFQILS